MDDNVILAKARLNKGTLVASHGKELTLLADVEAGWRIALADIPAGQPVVEHGKPLALSTGIRAGQAITRESVKRIQPRYVLPDDFRPPQPLAAEPNGATFLGIRRPGGGVGVRNWILVVPTVACCAHEAERIAAEATRQAFSSERYPQVDGIVALSHTEGCAFCDASAKRSTQVLADCVAHPNVGGAVLVELGCERIQAGAVSDQLDARVGSSKPVETVRVQDAGSEAAIRSGVGHISDMLPLADSVRRSEVSVRELVLGLKCGGSDGLSGTTANPALGCASDRLVRFGGAALITEMSEFSGAEVAFAQRAVSRELADEILAAFRAHEELAASADLTFEANPSPGNRAGGLFNAAVKASGSVAKAGMAPVSGVLQYGEPIGHRRGLHLVVCSANDLFSTPALVAAGAQIVCFTTGRGTAMGNPFAPVIKIASNTAVFNRMRCDMDVDAGPIAEGQETIQGVGQRIFDEILAVASGRRTAAERNQRREFALWTIGPAV